MAVYAYVRVSTSKQVEEGQSLEVQERIVRGYVLMLGKEISHVFVERGVSGSTPLHLRPQGKRMLSQAVAGDAIVTAKLDRMFRSAIDALEVLNRMKAGGIQLHMIDIGGDVTGNGVSKLVFTILSAVAEAERDRTRERIQEVKDDQKGLNRFRGGTRPFGYEVTRDGHLFPHEREYPFIKQILIWRADGASYRQIKTKLEDESVKDGKNPLSLSHVAIQRILKEHGEVVAEGEETGSG